MINELSKRAKLGALGAALLGVVLAVPAQFAVAQSHDAKHDPKIEQDIHKALDHKRFSGVRADIQNGVVVLTGTVDTFADKEDADRRVHHVDHVKGVDNEIEVASVRGSSSMSDEALRDKLAKQLAYDREATAPPRSTTSISAYIMAL